MFESLLIREIVQRHNSLVEAHNRQSAVLRAMIHVMCGMGPDVAAKLNAAYLRELAKVDQEQQKANEEALREFNESDAGKALSFLNKLMPGNTKENTNGG